jgi:hypothetical protein
MPKGFAGVWMAGTASIASALLSVGFRQSAGSASVCFPAAAVSGRELGSAVLTEAAAAWEPVPGEDSGNAVWAGFGAVSAGLSVTVNATFEGCSGWVLLEASCGDTEAAECCAASRPGLTDNSTAGFTASSSLLDEIGAGGAEGAMMAGPAVEGMLSEIGAVRGPLAS